MQFCGVMLLGLDPTHGPYCYHQYPPLETTSSNDQNRTAAAATTTTSSSCETIVPSAAAAASSNGSPLLAMGNLSSYNNNTTNTDADSSGGPSSGSGGVTSDAAQERTRLLAQIQRALVSTLQALCRSGDGNKEYTALKMTPDQWHACFAEGVGAKQRMVDAIVKAAAAAAPASSGSTGLTFPHSVLATVKNFAEVLLPRTELTGRVCWLYEADTPHLLMYMAQEFTGHQYSRNLMRMTLCFVFRCPPVMTPSSNWLEAELGSFSTALLNVAEVLKDAEERFNYLFHFLDPLGDYYDKLRPLRAMMRSQQQQQQHQNAGGAAAGGGASTGAATATASFSGGGLNSCLLKSSNMPTFDATFLHSQHIADLLHATTTTTSGEDSSESRQQQEIGKDEDFVSVSALQSIGGGNVNHDALGGGGALRFLSPSISAVEQQELQRISAAPTGRTPPILRRIRCNAAVVHPFFAPHDHTNKTESSSLSSSSSPASSSLSKTWYDLSYVVEQMYDCFTGACDSIPLSEQTTVSLHWSQKPKRGAYIYPHQVLVPVVSASVVIAELMGEDASWPDLGVTDVFLLIDGIRTVREVVEGFARQPLTKAQEAYLFTLTPPTEDAGKAGCKRGGDNQNTFNATSSNGKLWTTTSASSGAASWGRRATDQLVPPEWSHESMIALEAIQHLCQANLVRLTDPVLPTNVYHVTSAFYQVLTDPQHPCRCRLGFRMLAVEEVVCERDHGENSGQNSRSGGSLGPPPLGSRKHQQRQEHVHSTTAGGTPPQPLDGHFSSHRKTSTESAVSMNADEIAMEAAAAAAPGIPLSPKHHAAAAAAAAGSTSPPAPPPPQRSESMEMESDPTLEMEEAPLHHHHPNSKSSKETTTTSIMQQQQQQQHIASPGAAAAAAAAQPKSVEIEVASLEWNLSDWKVIAEVNNLAAQRGYGGEHEHPPQQRRSDSVQEEDHCHHDDTNDDDDAFTSTQPDARLVSRVDAAASAALLALARFQFSPVSLVAMQMRKNPAVKHHFNGWCKEAMVALVEYGVLNALLTLQK